MKLSEYFEKTRGYGVLATADSKGKVDVAAYSKPFFEGEDTVGFAMYDRLTHANLQGNPSAAPRRTPRPRWPPRPKWMA
jgi:hypothetical protein